MPAKYETAIKNCNSMAEIRKAKSGPLFVDAVTESLSPCIILLNDCVQSFLQHLILRSRSFGPLYSV